MAQEPESPLLGGKYRLVRELGRGSMGVVWQAEHVLLRSPVALKLIHPAVAREPGVVERFLREARAAAALRGPNVVQVLDFGIDAGAPYIAMELLEGESLAARLARVSRLGVRVADHILQQVARAIGRAHDAGIVHRDLKPENIFIVEEEHELSVKVLDFGIAKVLDRNFTGPASRVTLNGDVWGTPQYMSPEQAEGSRSLDHRTDIWALGIIVFEALLGRTPYSAKSSGRLLLEICTQPLPVPSTLGAVPKGFDAWFARACARKPSDRFPNARALASEFRRICDAHGVEQVRGSPPPQASRSRAASPRRSRRMSPAALGGLSAAAMGGLVWSALWLQQTRTQEEAVTRTSALEAVEAPAWQSKPGLGENALTTTLDAAKNALGLEPAGPRTGRGHPGAAAGEPGADPAAGVVEAPAASAFTEAAASTRDAAPASAPPAIPIEPSDGLAQPGAMPRPLGEAALSPRGSLTPAPALRVSARPSSPNRRSSPGRSSSKAEPEPSPDCDPPWALDSSGIRRVKRACL